MARQRVPPGAFFLVMTLALAIIAAMDLLTPGSYIKAAFSRDAPVLTPAQRADRFFERFTGRRPPRNPLPRR